MTDETTDLRARVRALEEITDPDFIWGAMDNVHDMDVTLDDYAMAVSRAQRAALAASQPADPVTNAGCRQPVQVKPQEPTSMTLAEALQVPEVRAAVDALRELLITADGESYAQYSSALEAAAAALHAIEEGK